MNWDLAAGIKLTVLAVCFSMTAACTFPVEQTSVPTPAEPQARLSPPPTAPGIFKEPSAGFSISFPESVSHPKPLDLPGLVFHVTSDSAIPVCQIFVTDLPDKEPLVPLTAKIWMMEKLLQKGFSDIEIVRAEIIVLEEGIEALFLAEKFEWQGKFYWGVHLIAEHDGKRITVFAFDDGRMDRIESTVMSLKLLGD